jgi:hypothetical protein
MNALKRKSLGMCYARARRTHIHMAWWHGSQQESTPGSTGTAGLQYRYWWCACGSQVRQCRERGVCYYIMIMGSNMTARLMCRYFGTPDSEAFSSTVDDPATLTLDQQGSPPAAGALGAEREHRTQ